MIIERPVLKQPEHTDGNIWSYVSQSRLNRAVCSGSSGLRESIDSTTQKRRS
jgi:hypothetical protein